MLRPGASLLAAAGQHRGWIYRSRVSLRRETNHPRRPGGPSDGQAARRPARRRRMLHQSRPRRSERLREPGAAAGGRRMQLLHGGADGRRRDALISIHQLSRRGGAPLGAQAAACARVRGLVRADGNCPRRPSDRARRRCANRDGRALKKGESSTDSSFDAMRKATPARLGVGRAGPRYTTVAMLSMRADHARAVDAVMTTVAPDWPRRNGLIEVHSDALTREDYLRYPERGRRLDDADAARVARLKPPPFRSPVPRGKASGVRFPGRRNSATPLVLLCIGDGLSSAAVEKNGAPLLRALTRRLAPRYRVLKPIFIRNARVR